jgi:putative nucleotidyltransferase with HDIG domain
MATMDELRAEVRASLPEVEWIEDADLRDKVVEAWAFALSQSEFTSIDEIRPSGNPNTPPMVAGTQSDHLRGVARMAVAMAEALAGVVGPFGVNRDILIACGLCHDVGKPFEFSPRNQERWKSNPAMAGYPSVRHPAYGVYVALTVGLPEPVVHACGAHSGEGEKVQRSLETTIVHHADYAFWHMLSRSGLLAEEWHTI